MKKIKIVTIKFEVPAELNHTKTANLIYEALPIESRVNTWGDEIYFKIPLKTDIEDGVETVQIGDIAYWPDGNCFCIFFGKTPVSTENEIRSASGVTIIGKLLDNPQKLKQIKSGEKIKVEKN